MDKINQKIQYFANSITLQIHGIENDLLDDDMSFSERKRLMFVSDTLQDVLERYENVFSDVLFKE